MSGLRHSAGALLLSCLLVLAAVPAAGQSDDETGDGPVEFEGCATLTEPGTYVLTDDIIDNRRVDLSEACIRIEADDVVLEGNGHTVDGNAVSDTTGIAVDSPDGTRNVTVRNVTVSDWDRGIHLDDATGSRVVGTNVTLNGQGISLTDSDRNAVTNNTASRNLLGIHLTRSDGNDVSGNVVTDNLVGIKLDGDSRDNDLANTTARGNDRVGILAPLRVVDLFGHALTVGPPLDPDDDGRYEDVTGNGTRNVWDSLALAVVVTTHGLGLSDLSADQVDALDFADNGALTADDVLALD